MKKFIANENIATNIFRIKTYNSIINEYFCTAFIDFMLKDKCFLDYTNSFSPIEYGKNDKIILKYFQRVLNKLSREKSIVLFVVSIENLKIQQCHTFSRKH